MRGCEQVVKVVFAVIHRSIKILGIVEKALD
jgi:hypothetical protein